MWYTPRLYTSNTWKGGYTLSCSGVTLALCSRVTSSSAQWTVYGAMYQIMLAKLQDKFLNSYTIISQVISGIKKFLE